MGRKLTFDTLPELRAAIALIANSGASADAQLSRIQSVIVHSGDAAMLAGLPSGQYRKGLTSAMSVHQTKDGRKYPACILCGLAVSADKGKDFPSAPALITLVPSALFADSETLAEVSPGSSPRLGYLPGNVALACKACADWKATDEGLGVVLSADIIDASMVLTSWSGVKASKQRKDDDTLDSLARRAEARRVALGV